MSFSHAARFYLCGGHTFVRPSSTSAAASAAILLRLREDLKMAMRAKDSARLAVVRSILNDITNASKTARPVGDDVQLCALLLKKIAQSKDAAQQFRDAQREDLAVKEDGDAGVMKDYVDQIGEATGGAVTVDEMQRVVGRMLESWRDGKPAMGRVLDRVIRPGGPLNGRIVDRSQLADAVRKALGA